MARHLRADESFEIPILQRRAVRDPARRFRLCRSASQRATIEALAPAQSGPLFWSKNPAGGAFAARKGRSRCHEFLSGDALSLPGRGCFFIPGPPSPSLETPWPERQIYSAIASPALAAARCRLAQEGYVPSSVRQLSYGKSPVFCRAASFRGIA